MNFSRAAVALAALAILHISTVGLAQSAQSSCNGTALTGVVHDATDAIISGAAVKLDNSNAAVTDSAGHFHLSCAPNGKHTLHISAESFAALDLPVNVSAHSGELKITLQPAEVDTTMDVAADDPSQAANSPLASGPSQTISGQRLQSLADDPDDLLRELQQMAAAAGGSPSGATLSIDGFQSGDNNNTLPPKSSIAYIKVNPDLFSAEYRNPPFGGGQIQVYTKPGQPTYHGALFATNSSSWMNARDPFSVSRAAIGKQRYGFELTGPIRKKGSDFILNLEHRSINNFAAVNAIGVDAAGDQTPILQNVPAPQRLWIGMAKVDWQLGPKNTFITSFNAFDNHKENVGAGGTTLAEAAYDNQIYDHNLHLTDVTTVSPKLMHEARLGIEWDGRDEIPNSLDPQLQVAGAFTSGGNTNGALRDHEIDTEFDDDAILSLSKHLLKFGSQSELLRERFRYFNNFNGTWLFGGGAAPVLDANNNPTAQTETITGVAQYVRALNGWAGGTPTEYSNVAGNPTINLTQYREALFVQDDWKLLPNLHVALGLRYYTQNKPMVHNNFNPRLGISWSPDKKATWTLHAHAGLFSGRFGAHNYAQLLDMDGTQRITSLVYTPSCSGGFNPNTCNAFTGATPLQSIRTIQPHLPNLFYGIENVGFTKTFPKSFTLSGDYNIAQMWHYTRTENINAPTNDQPLGPRPFAPDVNILQWQPSGRGYGNIEFMGLTNQSLKRVKFFAGAVRVDIIDDTDDTDFTTPQTTGVNTGEYARRDNQGLWQVFGNATVNLPAKLVFSANYNGTGLQAYNVTTGFDNNGDGDFNDRPQYAPAGTPLCSANPNATPCGYTTPWGELVTSGGVGTLSRNKGDMPWTFYLDSNLQRTFNLTRNAKADHPQALIVNIRSSNVLNHLNVTSVGSVLGSPNFGQAYAGDNGRRLEGGLRYTF
jgi:hypothetical protein